MKNTLHIKREHWPDVTEVPHFIVDLHYEGLAYRCDEIYFDNLDGIVPKLLELERTRKGRVLMHGGFRFQLIVQAMPSGGVNLNFKTESDATFPGKSKIEGCFSVDGEHAATTIGALTGLLNGYDDFVL